MVEDLSNLTATDDVQRELDLMLRVEPSPEFLTRVRIHVATGVMLAPWWTVNRMAAAAGAVATGIVLAAGMAVSDRGDLPALPAPPRIAMAVGSIESPSIPEGPAVSSERKPNIDSCRLSAPPCNSTTPRLEVIVSNAEVEGLRSLIATLRNGVTVPEVPATAGELTIEPLTIAQLAPDLELQ